MIMRMKLCKRCGGSGSLLRPKLRPVKSRCVTCTDCGGWGTKPAPSTDSLTEKEG